MPASRRRRRRPLLHPRAATATNDPARWLDDMLDEGELRLDLAPERGLLVARKIVERGGFGDRLLERVEKVGVGGRERHNGPSPPYPTYILLWLCITRRW